MNIRAILAINLALFIATPMAISDPDRRLPRLMIDGLPILALDMNGDGIISSKPHRGSGTTTYFDLDNDDFSELTGWVKPEDGILAIDLNSNGFIDNAHELLASQEISGLDNLQKNHDADHNGFIDAQDPLFNQLRIWIDSNQDGISQEPELLPLRHHGITSLSVNAVDSRQEITADHTVSARGSYQRGKQENTILELSFVADNAVTMHTNEYLRDIYPYEVAGCCMSNLKGFGLVADLFIVMKEDATAYQSIMHLTETDLEDVMNNGLELLASWSGFNKIHNRAYMGPELSRLEKLWVLNRFMGDQDEKPVSHEPSSRDQWSHSADTDESNTNRKFFCYTNFFIYKLIERTHFGGEIFGAHYETWPNKFVISYQKNLEDSIVEYANSPHEEFEMAVFSRMIIDLLHGMPVDKKNLASQISPQPYNKLLIGILNGSIHTDSNRSCLAFRGTHKNDLRIGNRESTEFDLGPGDDIAYGLNGDDIMIGGRGNDYLSGGKGNDKYIYFLGRDGVDTINENGSINDIDTLEIINVASIKQPWFSRNNDDLVIEFLGIDENKVIIKNWFKSKSQQIEKINIVTDFATFTLINDQSGRSALDKFMGGMLETVKPDKIEALSNISVIRYRHAFITDGILKTVLLSLHKSLLLLLLLSLTGLTAIIAFLYYRRITAC